MKNIVDRVMLSDSYSISCIIKGGWQLAGGHGLVDRDLSIEDMFKFVESGITTFDCADIYTGVEEMIGEFLKKYKSRFGVNRAGDIQIHTKFVPDLDFLPTVNKRYVRKIIDRTLKRLGVERIDLVQFHWWDYEVPSYVEAASYLEDLKNDGKIRLLGVTNFDVPHLKEIIDSGVSIVSNQVQYSILDHRPENGMMDFCLGRDIKLLCYGTIAGGFLSEKYLGIDEVLEPFENRSLTKYKLIIDDFGRWGLFQELLVILDEIAKKHSVDIANVAESYILREKAVAGIIVGVRNSKHLNATLSIFDFSLDDEDLDMIDKVLAKSVGPKGDVYGLERVKNGKHESIMKYNLNSQQK